MTELTFYTNPMSRGRIVRWMLEETGISYTTEIIDYAEIKNPAYLKVNPMGKVPAITHGKKVVTECAAICAYLADTFADAGLAPAPSDRADYYRWLFYAAGPMEHAIINSSLGFELTAEQYRTAGYGNLQLVVDVVAEAVNGRQFLCNDQFSAADVYLGSQLAWGLQFGTLPKRHEFEEYVSGLVQRPAYIRAAELDDALLAPITADPD